MARIARFVVSLNAPVPTGATASVAYTTVPGTAVAPSDFTQIAGTLVFTATQQSKNLDIAIRDDIPGNVSEQFTVALSAPTVTGNITLSIVPPGFGTAVIPSGTAVPLPVGIYIDRFNTIYNAMHDNANGYFGPQTGPNAFKVPRHVPEIDSRIIIEAPDYGGETVSETASFWVGLETWKGYVSGDWAPYNNAWNMIEQFYIPSPANQPMETYNPAVPASYIPESNNPSDYPRPNQTSAVVGPDPLAAELETTYGNKRSYLMHWIEDVEGDYQFHNGDGATKIVFINTFERGGFESSYETVTHPCWNDWTNGGGAQGYEPLFTQGTQSYPSAPFAYGKKWGYTNAPDAEARAIQWAFWANKFALEQGNTQAASITASQTKAKKMGDYMRYNLADKYFRQIGTNTIAGVGKNSFHYLINWYTAWGGEIPAAGATSSYGYRVGSSDAHHGYQCVTAAYAMATGGGNLQGLSPTAAGDWLTSLYRQIEMIRWLQSPEGPVAGGVTSSWEAQYNIPTDGRQNAKFYGMYYNYSPVFQDPPSNDWVGFQAWGHGRTADLFLESTLTTSSLTAAIRTNLEIILDRLMNWFMDNTVFNVDGTFELPTLLSWVNNTQVVGQTTTVPNIAGKYEFLPNMTWPGTGTPDYATFWNPSTVPNPNLHCTIVHRGADLGVASSLCYAMLTYAKGKRNLGKFTTPIMPGSVHTAATCVDVAKDILDSIWTHYKDAAGIAAPEIRSDYRRMKDPVYIPSIFTGTMPAGGTINQSSTFINLRPFLMTDPKWPEVEAYIDNPLTAPAPTFTYHRFWANTEFAISCAALHHWFADIIYA